MLNRVRRWLRQGRNGPQSRGVLSPTEGYRRWALDYGHEPNALQQLEAASIDLLLPDVAGHQVLDLGCGKGRLSRRVMELGAARAIAADLSPAMLTDSLVYSGPKLVASVGGQLPFEDASFDTVICALVLGHVADLEGALTAMAAVLRPGGQLLISDFHPYATLRGWERTFIDAEKGETWAIAQHLHMLSSYVGILHQQGLTLEALEEPQWQGSPVVFVLRARKADGAGSVTRTPP